jgi:hypothetical protein
MASHRTATSLHGAATTYTKSHGKNALPAAPGSSAERNGFQRSNTGKSSEDNLFFNTLWEKHRPRFGSYV